MDSTMTKAKQKSIYWQVIRGLCIISVISIHCPSAIESSRSEAWFWLYFFIRQLTNFPVAVFLFMAGYFTKIDRWENDPRNEVCFRIRRLLVPYIIWSIVYIGIKTLLKEQMSVLEVVGEFFLGKAASPFYYVVVLLQLTLLTWLMIRAASSKRLFWSIAIWCLTAISLVVLYLCSAWHDTIPWYCDTIFPVWILFFYLGIVFRLNQNRASFFDVLGKWWMIVLMFLVNILEAAYWLDRSPKLAISQNRFGAYLYSLAIISFVYKQSNTEHSQTYIRNGLKWIGDNSFALFWIHCLIIEFVKRVLSKVPKVDTWIMRYSMCLVLTVVLSISCIILVKRIARKAGLERYLYIIGFR